MNHFIETLYLSYVTFLSQCQQIVKVDVSSELELCLVAVRGWHECADCAI